MSLKMLLPLSAALMLIASCRPKPLDIDIPQSSGAFSIASYCPDNHSVYVSASYSVSAMLKVLDTATLKDLPDATGSLLLKDAVVTLRNPDNTIDTLRNLSPGIYSRTDLHLQPGQSYTLTVFDTKKGVLATATTSYQPTPALDTLYPSLIKRSSDTSCRLHLQMRDISPSSYFFVSYNTVRQAREHTSELPKNARALSLFIPKQIALFNAADASGGRLEKDITLQVNANDTVLVQVAQVDKAYYDYLTAYKRTGSLINQLTGEPIHLPTNIMSGYGYFSLFNPVKKAYDLNGF
jgi:hypothetical protein